MAQECLTGRPFTTPLARTPTASRNQTARWRARGNRRIHRDTGLLKILERSHSGAGRALAGTFVGTPVLRDTDPEEVREAGCVGVGQSGISAFDPPQRCGGDLGRRCQLGLGQPFDYTPVTGVALVD